MTGFSFGSFNTPATTANFGFGSSLTTPATTSTGFGAFGSSLTTPTTTSSAFGGFGSSFNTATTTSPGFSFGTNVPTPTTSVAPGYMFGSAMSMPTTSGFGFGTGFNAPTTTTSGFGFGTALTNPTTTSTFGSSFGTPASSSAFGAPSGGLFGKTGFSSGFSSGTGGLFSAPKTTTAAFNLGGSNFKPFGQQQTQPTWQVGQQQQQNIDPNVSLYMAVCAPAYFNDERDEVLKKWNQLQAIWGSGKGYYAPNMPPVDFNPSNPFCHFKAVGYVKLPSYAAEDGFVEIIIAKKESEVRANQQQIVDTLVKAFEGSQVCVEYVHEFGEKTRFCIYVQQRNPNGETKKAQSWQVHSHLTSINMKQLLQNLCVESVTQLVSLSDSQMKEYLDSPPEGIDPMIWEQGKRANPDPKKYLPVPMIGFQELKARFKAQEEESRLLQGQLDGVAEEITQLESQQAKLLANLKECKRRQIEMSHRVLKLVIKQEINRKRGVPIEEGEEHLRMLLEALQSQLSSPTQYMGRLNELLSQISIHSGNWTGSDSKRYSLDNEAEKEIQQFLSWEQSAIKELVSIVKADSDTARQMITLDKTL